MIPLQSERLGFYFMSLLSVSCLPRKSSGYGWMCVTIGTFFSYLLRTLLCLMLDSWAALGLVKHCLL